MARDGTGESLPPTPRDASRGIRVPIAVLRHLVDTNIPTDTRYHEFLAVEHGTVPRRFTLLAPDGPIEDQITVAVSSRDSLATGHGP